MDDDFLRDLMQMGIEAEAQDVATHGLFRVRRENAYRPNSSAFNAPLNATFLGNFRPPPAMAALQMENGEVNGQSQREALAACVAVQLGAVRGPITRGDGGPVDFYDANGLPFDVKTPAGGKDIGQAARSVIHEMTGGGQMSANGQNYQPRVVLDTTFLSNAERGALWGHLASYANERRLIEVVLPYSSRAKVVKFG